MQLWIYFQAGAGGDGVANLFERSDNVTPIDGVVDYWRIHRIVDGSVKFYAPTIDIHGCFRFNQPFKTSNNRLTDGYIDIVNQNFNCVVTSHDINLDLLLASDQQDILLKDQIKVLLTSKNHQDDAIKATVKNLSPVVKIIKKPFFHVEKFDYVLDVDQIRSDWNYVTDFCKAVGLDLKKYQYLQYLDLLKGNKTFMTNNFNVEEWTSKIDNDRVEYTLINIWQPGSG